MSRQRLLALVCLLSAAALPACGQSLDPSPSPSTSQQALTELTADGAVLLPTPTPNPPLCPPPLIDPSRSLAVTDTAILDRTFSFERVMTQIAATSQDLNDTKERLYREWFDTQNTNALAVTTAALHCDEGVNQQGQALFNGFPFQCPRTEGQLARTDPFTDPARNPNAYFPIGLFNRFDLANQKGGYGGDGSHCGEYRIIFAKRAGGIEGRNLIIFEGVLPNPVPHKGFKACEPVAKFWASLSAINDTATRKAMLEEFYFVGLPGFSPVVHAQHYGPQGGQIRTNQFLQRDWNLREFKLDEGCPNIKPIDPIEPVLDTDRIVRPINPCRAAIVQDTVKVNPYGPLFDVNSPEFDLAFQSFMGDQAGTLSINDINGFTMADNDQFNSGESDSQLPSNGVYELELGTSGSMHQTITANIPFGSGLNATHIAARAKALSCAGCHELSNGQDLGQGIRWPSSLGFVHVSEFPSNGSFPISPALQDVFLPHRERILSDFLVNQCLDAACAAGTDPTCSTSRLQLRATPTTGTISGTSRVH